MKNIKKYLACVFIFVFLLIVLTACENTGLEIEPVLDFLDLKEEHTGNTVEQSAQFDLFLPLTVEKSFFENRILANITDGDALRQINSYYRTKSSVSEFGVFVYALDKSMSEREKRILLGYLLEYTGLTGDDIIQMYAEHGIPYDESIPVEARLLSLPQELIKTTDEQHGRYNFAYKRSALSIRKEIFDEYGLTDGHIQKFFDSAEIMYEKFAGFFPKFELPDVFAYHAVPPQWGSEPGLYYDYSDIPSFAWADSRLGATFYYENPIAKLLSIIDTGFPDIVAHEIGHLFTITSYGIHQPDWYVWDNELFANLAQYYLASYSSEFTLILPNGEEVDRNTSNWPERQWRKFFGLIEKYGYELLSEALKEAMALVKENPPNDMSNHQAVQKTRFNFFRKALSQITGEDMDEYFFDTPEFVNIKNEIYDMEMGVLDLSFRELEDSDIEPLKNMANLTKLNLGGNKISDVSALAELTNLTNLILSINQISDVNILAGLTNLTELYLDFNQIGDISALAGLTELKRLQLNATQIKDMSVLEKLTNLTALGLSNNQISDVSILAGLTNLKMLVLSNNQISDISALKNLTDLTSLYLFDNLLTPEQIAELREALPDTEIIASNIFEQ